MIIGPTLPVRCAKTRVGSAKAKIDTKVADFMIKKNVDLQGKNVVTEKNVGGQKKHS